MHWECTLEIPKECCLDELHRAIINAIEFDDDHIYEFCIANSYHSRNAKRIACDDDKNNQETIEIVLSNMKGKKLFYMFDYEDSWLFQINKSRKKRFNDIPDIFTPELYY